MERNKVKCSPARFGRVPTPKAALGCSPGVRAVRGLRAHWGHQMGLMMSGTALQGESTAETSMCKNRGRCHNTCGQCPCRPTQSSAVPHSSHSRVPPSCMWLHPGAPWGRGAVREGAARGQVHVERVFTEKYIDVHSLKEQIQSFSWVFWNVSSNISKTFFSPIFAQMSPCYSHVVIMIWPCQKLLCSPVMVAQNQNPQPNIAVVSPGEDGEKESSVQKDLLLLQRQADICQVLRIPLAPPAANSWKAPEQNIWTLENTKGRILTISTEKCIG